MEDSEVFIELGSDGNQTERSIRAMKRRSKRERKKINTNGPIDNNLEDMEDFDIDECDEYV